MPVGKPFRRDNTGGRPVTHAQQPARRGRGSRAGLDRVRIVAAARDMDPETLTMQSLAETLGVDRKALNHHVTDRRNLFELVALDVFGRRFGEAEVALGETWQDACRAYGRALAQSLIDIGPWTQHIHFTSQRELAVVGPAETVAERLLGAGFDPATVSRAMHLLATIAAGFARDALIGRRAEGHPDIEELRRALDSTSDDYAGLRVLMAERVDNFGDAQLTFDIDTFIAGIEQLPR